jgi:hypothetical protein
MAVTIELRELGLHGMAQPEPCCRGDDGREDKQHDAGEKQPGEPASVPTQLCSSANGINASRH